jgi:molybdopterin synthase catalytic subunit
MASRMVGFLRPSMGGHHPGRPGATRASQGHHLNTVVLYHVDVALDPLPASEEASAQPAVRPDGEDWIALSETRLPVETASSWVVRPDCGGIVVFVGTVRDHADGRAGVSELVYEAYAEMAAKRMADLASEARRQWPELGRLLIWHRTGRLAVTEVAVIVAVSSPHRGEAFDAAEWLIDTVKHSVPIWKQETWEGGQGWGVDARPITDPIPDNGRPDSGRVVR